MAHENALPSPTDAPLSIEDVLIRMKMRLPQGVRTLRLPCELLSDIPSWIGEFADLQTLYLSQNRLCKVNEQLGVLPHLR